MGVIATAVKHVLAAKMSQDDIVAAVADMEANDPGDVQAERRRAADRERKRLRNLRKSAEGAEVVPPKEKSPLHPPKEITPSQSVPEANASSTDNTRSRFAAFWSLYPHKVGKAAAEVAFVKAIRKVSFEALMAGLKAYVAKTDDRPWCNPATWLNQGRWDDAPALPAPQARGSPPQHTPTLADIFSEAAKRRNSDGQTDEDSYGARAPVSYLPAARSG